MTETRAKYHAGSEPDRAAAIHVRLVVAIERYLKDHPETSRDEISQALATVKAAYDSGESPINQ